jgi:hypothetical protein
MPIASIVFKINPQLQSDAFRKKKNFRGMPLHSIRSREGVWRKTAMILDYGWVAPWRGPAVPFRSFRPVLLLRCPNPSSAKEGCRFSSHSPSPLDGLEIGRRQRGGGRRWGGADDAGRALPDQRGASRAALQVPQGASGGARRPQL